MQALPLHQDTGICWDICSGFKRSMGKWYFCVWLEVL